MKNVRVKHLALGLSAAVIGLGAYSADAAIVTLTGIDGFGSSSFNTVGLWDNAAAPSAGNDYFVPDGTRLRTPPDGNSYAFAGDSLTINNLTAYGDGFMFKGTGNTGTITVDNLIMDGGLISHANGIGDVFQLDGAMSVVGDSRIYAKQGPIYIYSDISGSAQITNEAPDSPIECKLWIGSSANTYTGNIVNHGRIELLDDANLNFVIGASGVNNDITDGGSQKHIIFGGDFVLDLTSAGTTIGDSWSLIATTSASTYYTNTFNMVGFTELGDGLTWLKPIDASSSYRFQESTGILSVVPEPASLALMALGGAVMLRRR